MKKNIKIVISALFLANIFWEVAAQQRIYPPSKIPVPKFSNTLKKQLKELKTDPTLQIFAENRKRFSKDRFRLIYHLASAEDILHDANGLCFWQGKWHLFYQALPKRDDGRQHWGHAMSDDLIHWEDLPYAIYPGPEEKVFSGSTLVDGDKVIAMYHGTKFGNIVASSSDPLLLNWEKIALPAVAVEDPNGEKLPYTVFDPCIWKEGDTYYSISGGGRKDGPGAYKTRTSALFSSKDLVKWEYMHEFMVNERFLMPGEDAACPYFWPIGDRYIFLFFSHIAGGQYLLGDYDKVNQLFSPTSHARFNFRAWGPGGVHAPSATPDGKGGVIVIFNMTGINFHKTKDKIIPGWKGVMTLPRRLSLSEKDSLCVEPAGDYESLRFDHKRIENLDISANEEIVLDGFGGNAVEIKAEIDLKGSQMFELNVLRSPGKEEYTSIKFFKDRGFRQNMFNPKATRADYQSLISLETAYSSILPDAHSRAPEVAPILLKRGERLRLHIFIDKSIIEVFVNEKQVLASRVFPGRDDSLGISLRSQGVDAQLKHMDLWQMKDIYE